MKCILLLTFVALCYSFPSSTEYGTRYGNGRNININEDGTIVITGPGKRIIISKDQGRKNVDILVSGPNIPTKRIQINDQNQLSVSGQGESESSDEYLRDKRSSRDSKKQRDQGETLTKILSGYQGDVDQTSYQQLLKEINAAVQEGQLSSSVYDVLQSLNQAEQQQQGLWGKQQGIQGRQGDVLDLLRQQAIEQQLQQLRQEQQYKQLLQQQYQQGVRSPVLGQRPQVVDVPVGVTQEGDQIIKRVTLWGPQSLAYQRQQGIRELGVTGQQGVGDISYITGTETGRTPLGTSIRDLLVGYGRQTGQYGPIGQPISTQLSEVIQDEREILDEQRQIQQQQLQQQQEQQQLLRQQWLQQQQQQRQQEMLRQIQQQQWLEQQQLLEQRQQPASLRDYLLNGGRSYTQTRGQQGLWQQQSGVYPQWGLYGGYGQSIPRTQRYNVPLVL